MIDRLKEVWNKLHTKQKMVMKYNFYNMFGNRTTNKRKGE